MVGGSVVGRFVVAGARVVALVVAGLVVPGAVLPEVEGCLVLPGVVAPVEVPLVTDSLVCELPEEPLVSPG